MIYLAAFYALMGLLIATPIAATTWQYIERGLRLRFIVCLLVLFLFWPFFTLRLIYEDLSQD